MSESILETIVPQFIIDERIPFAPPILVAISGGLDSTVLAHYLHELEIPIGLVHCNFNLRGAASAEDEDAVRLMAARMGVPVHVRSFDTAAERAPGESIQMVARRLRYDYFTEIISDGLYSVLVTAHHADDNLETFLINLLRGTGLKGLAGIEPLSFPEDTVLARPLLGVTRAQILDYAERHGLEWREDDSNASDKYLRNRVRHQLLPVLREQFGFGGAGFIPTARHLRSEDYLLDLLRDDHVNELIAKPIGEGPVVLSKEELPIRFADCQTLLRVYYLKFGFTDEQFRQVYFTERPLTFRTEQTILSGNRNEITFDIDENTEPQPINPVSIEELPFEQEYGARMLDIRRVSFRDMRSEPDTVYLRPSPLPWLLRTRQDGDRFKPLGMQGRSKKIQDFFVDEKVPREDRDFIPLLCAANGEIMSVPGLRISEEYRIRPEDEEVIEVSLKRENPKA